MKLYDGIISIEFVEGSHKYLVQHKVGDIWLEAKPVVGTTTLCGALAKDFLAPWAAKLAAEYMAKVTEGSDAKRIDEAKRQFKLAADEGARAGKLGHAFVEAKLKKEEFEYPEDDKDVLVVDSVAQAFEGFMRDWSPEIVGIEEILYSKTHNFAGTADFIAKVDGKLVIGDWKTTNTSRYNPDGIYPTYFAQLGAYSLAYEEMTGEEVEELMVVNLPKDGGEYKLKRLEDIGLSKVEAQAYFLALKQAYELNQKFEWALKRG